MHAGCSSQDLYLSFLLKPGQNEETQCRIPFNHCKCVHYLAFVRSPSCFGLFINFMLSVFVCLFYVLFVYCFCMHSIKNHKYRPSALTSQSILQRQLIHVCKPQAIEGCQLRRSVENNFTLPGGES